MGWRAEGRGLRGATGRPPAQACRPLACGGHAYRRPAEGRPLAADTPPAPPTQNGVASGLMQMLLLKVSAHITEQLGVAPGGEFREAFKEVGPGPTGGGGSGVVPGPGVPHRHSNTPPLPRPAGCRSASSTWATGPSLSPSSGPSLPSPSGRRSSWPGACAFCRTPSGRSAQPPDWGCGQPPHVTRSDCPAVRPAPEFPGWVSSCRAAPPLLPWGPDGGGGDPALGPPPQRRPPPPSKDDVERCKQKDLLEQMMAEMVGEFPDLHRTIVSERDVYLTYMLRQAARRLELPRASDGEHSARGHGAPQGTGVLRCHASPTPAEPRKCVPSVVVGVVGMGHVPGIEKNWTTDLNIQEIMT